MKSNKCPPVICEVRRPTAYVVQNLSYHRSHCPRKQCRERPLAEFMHATMYQELKTPTRY